LGRHSRCPRRSQDDIDPGPHQFLGMLRKLINAAIGESVLHDHILTIEVSRLAQPLLKRLDEVRRRLPSAEEADPPYLPHLLRLGDQRRGRAPSVSPQRNVRRFIIG
jgi:hypothetical protein